MDLERHLAHLPLHFGGAASGADLFRRACLILVLIIVEIHLGDDLDGRERPVLKDRTGEFPALDHLFHQDIRPEFEARFHCRLYAVLGRDHIDADRRAAGRCFDHTGRFDLFRNMRGRLHGVIIACDRACMKCLPGGHPHSLVLYHLLGDHLVHRHGSAKIAGSRVGNAEHIERGLHAAVLAVHAVERHEHNIRQTADLQNAFAEQGRTLPFSRFPDSVKVRCFSVECSCRQLRQVLEKGGRILRNIFKPHEQVNKDRLVPSRPECPAYLCSREKRDISFCAESAAQDNDFHNDLLVVSGSAAITPPIIAYRAASPAALSKISKYYAFFGFLPLLAGIMTF